MSFAPGTALQNGHYIVDALLEAAPNGDLYWGTHVVTGQRVFLQMLPISSPESSADLSELIARLEGIAPSPLSPLPHPFTLFKGDEQSLCLAIDQTIGLPWSSVCETPAPLSPKQALATIRQIAKSVDWLQQQRLEGFDLSPNRVWLSPSTSDSVGVITLTGLPHHAGGTPSDAACRHPVPACAYLLQSFLTGELPPTEDAVVVARRLRQQLPTLSPLIAEAIIQGRQAAQASPALTLPQWLEQLPDASAIAPIPRSQGSLPRPYPQPPGRRRTQSKAYPALAGTALIAAIAGVTLGTTWRLNAPSLPGVLQLDPQQSFPAQVDWPGDTPDVNFEGPFVPSHATPRPREEWYEEPEILPEEPLWESPANAAEWTEPGVGPEPAPELPNEAPFPGNVEPDEVPPPPLEADPFDNEQLPAPEIPQDFAPPPLDKSPVSPDATSLSGGNEPPPQALTETEFKPMPDPGVASES
ncbi:MAG: hypothetical protein AAF283_00955 [Cyanobacteria bacterium P01_A01_bin.70]